jgi:glycerol-3-phosphate dehydrogenase
MPDSQSSLEYDVIIIGAGINGAGIARDAAMRGLKVLLLDKGDIGSGTSSWSTRLIHGGLRYLEHGEFGLVRESLRERETLLRIAPHLVRPLPMTIPIYQDSRRGRTTIRVGLTAYDLLSLGKSLPRHQMQSHEETMRQLPALNPYNLVGSAIYYDAQVVFVERLILENALSAQQHGAAIVTYARVSKIEGSDGKVTEVEFVDALACRHTVQGHIVINAAGPWVDQLLGETSQLIGGTKGSHLVVAPFPGAPAHGIYVEAKSDGRPFFILPWNDNYLIGTTDVRFENDLDEVRCESWEIDYLLDGTNRVFPMAAFTRDQILFTYSGVRPLAFTDNKDEQSITRRHFVRAHPTFKNLLSIVGGKLTTYRSLAEECVDLVFERLGRPPAVCRTRSPLPGSEHLDSFGETALQQFPQQVRTRLLKVYGSRAAAFAQLCEKDSSLSEPFNREGDALSAEVVFAFKSEMATTLSDCLMRRTMVGLNARLGVGDDVAAAEVAKRFLDWSDERARSEVLAHREYIRRFAVPMSDML